MAQFYSEKINKKVDKVLNFMSKKDSDLNIFISNEVKNYSQSGKKLGKLTFEKGFYGIYNFEIPAIEPIIKKFFLFNSQDFKNVDNFKGVINNFDISFENTHVLDVVFKQKVDELCNTSYSKYLSLINLYDNELQKNLKIVLKRIDYGS
jgi:hypothetical protein